MQRCFAALNMTSVLSMRFVARPPVQLQIPRGLTSARDDKQILAALGWAAEVGCPT